MKRSLALLCLGLALPLQAAEVPAQLAWSQRVELAPRVSGTLREVTVQPGQRVRRGQVLASLDARPAEARVHEQRAAVPRLRHEQADAALNLTRIQELYDRGVIASSELEQARLRQQRAVSLLQEGEARVRVAEHEADEARLRAPFDALVVARLAEPGQAIGAGLQPQPVLVLARAGEMVARARISDEQATRLRPGQAVTVVVGGVRYPGKVRSLGLEPVAGSKPDAPHYPLDVVFTPRDVLRAGAAASVLLP